MFPLIILYIKSNTAETSQVNASTSIASKLPSKIFDMVASVPHRIMVRKAQKYDIIALELKNIDSLPFIAAVMN
jgi:hypothetical protein